MDNELRRIANLVRQRQQAEARRALGRYLKTHPDSAEAWYILSFVEGDANSRVRAVQQAATLDPSNAKYGERLARLLNTAPRSGRRWWRLAAVLVVLMLVATGVILAARYLDHPAITLPTQAAFALDETQAPMGVPPAEAITITTEMSSAKVQLSARREPTRAAPVEYTLSPIPSSPTPVFTTMPSPTIPVSPPINTAVPGPVRATDIPTSVPPTATANPTSAVPTSVVVSGEIPLREGADVDAGEMRVVDIFRRASAEILERGGSIPPAPPGEEWVLVELLLICEGEGNCTPEIGALNLTGSSGRPYPPAAAFQLEPVFNRDAFIAGQVWGYLGFVVPNSEGSLWLTLGQGGVVYRFALQ